MRKRTLRQAAVGILAVAFFSFPLPLCVGQDVPFIAKGVEPAAELGSKVFTSRSGITFSYLDTWEAKSVLKGNMEAVYLHPKTPDSGRRPQWPSDYKPANFRAMKLIQLLILPKGSPGGHKDLKELRKAKEADLEGQGADYYIAEKGLSPAPDTFKVLMSAPHQLIQVYTQTPEHFIIMTAGGGREAWGAYALTVRTLHEYIAQFYPPEAKPYDRWKPLESFKYSDYSSFWNPYFAINGSFLALAFFPWPKKIRSRLKVVGLSLFGFSNVMAVAAGIIAFIPYFLRLPNWRNGTHVCVAIVLFMPWICRLVSDQFRGIQRGRVFWWTFGLSILLLASVVPGFNNPMSSKHLLPIFGFVVSWMLGLMYGACFGFTFLAAEKGSDVTPNSGP